MKTGQESAGGLAPRRIWRPLPLVVDLDGGLLARDPVRDVLGWALRHRPGAAVAALWRHRRRPDLAARALAQRYPDARLGLRVNGEVLDLIAVQRRCGGTVVLLGAAPIEMVEGVARALGLPDAAYGADRRRRFGPEGRALAAVSLFGRRGFDFAGGRADQAPLGFAARRALMVRVDAGLMARLRTAGGVPVRLGQPHWQALDVTLADLGGACDRGRAERLLARSLSATIWDAAGPPVAPVADPVAWQDATETSGHRAGGPPGMLPRAGAG